VRWSIATHGLWSFVVDDFNDFRSMDWALLGLAVLGQLVGGGAGRIKLHDDRTLPRSALVRYRDGMSTKPLSEGGRGHRWCWPMR
jgi:hypothetical protein